MLSGDGASRQGAPLATQHRSPPSGRSPTHLIYSLVGSRCHEGPAFLFARAFTTATPVALLLPGLPPESGTGWQKRGESAGQSGHDPEDFLLLAGDGRTTLHLRARGVWL